MIIFRIFFCRKPGPIIGSNWPRLFCAHRIQILAPSQIATTDRPSFISEKPIINSASEHCSLNERAWLGTHRKKNIYIIIHGVQKYSAVHRRLHRLAVRKMDDMRLASHRIHRANREDQAVLEGTEEIEQRRQNACRLSNRYRLRKTVCWRLRDEV